MNTTVKTTELMFYLEKTTVEIQFKILKNGQIQEKSWFRTFQELLTMDALDLAFGYKRRRKIKIQTTKNMARLLASMIINAMLKVGPGFVDLENHLMSWNECKKNHIWTEFSIQSDSQTIYRLDWFIHRLLLNNSMSIDEWLRSTESFKLTSVDHGSDYVSDLEYDGDLQSDTESEATLPKPETRKKRKFQALLNFFSCFK